MTHPPCALPRRLACALLLAACLAAIPLATSSGAARSAPPEEESEATGVVIRLLPPATGRQGDKVRIETLVTDPAVHNVVFFVDGEQAARRRSPPWATELRLATPPREQRVRAEARDRDDVLLAADEIAVNRQVRPLKVSLRSIEPVAAGLLLRAELSLPEAVRLDQLEVYLNEERRHAWTAAQLANGELAGASFADGRLEATLETDAADPRDFVRVVARLADGRQIEDVELVTGREFAEEVAVHLVQLQVVVTNRRGLPMRGFTREHFRIRDAGGPREAAGLFPADEVTLLMGLALDSSGSMRRLWPQTREAAVGFLGETLLDRDEGFLVDFDTRLRLVQERTGDRSRLLAALEGLEPEGGTALYDSILYSLLQFDGQQGRRGLVVLTDGQDFDSQADPGRAVEFGRKLGVPIYIVAIDGPATRGRLPSRGVTSSISDPAAAIQALHLVTDPTGGRLFRAASPDQIHRAFEVINAELRNQYVLTYYTDTPPEPGRPPRVEIEAPGFQGLQAKVVFGADQVY